MRHAVAQTGNVLAAAVVVLGLFLMHGMTADHALPMPMTDAGTLHLGSAPLTDSTAHTPVITPHAIADEAPSVLSPVLPGHSDGMAVACLALLGGAVVLLPLLLGGRRLSHRERAPVGTAVIWTRVLRRPPGMRAPLLTRLCILRT